VPVPDITDDNGVAHAIVAAAQDIASQDIPGHDLETVKPRLSDSFTIVRATLAYQDARKAGKHPKAAARDTAITLVARYRALHRI